MAETDNATRAEELKNEGNTFFKAGKYAEAVEYYTKSLEIQPAAPVLCNRAFAQLKLEAFGLAISDANDSIELDPSFIKAYYRRASAQLALGKYEDARGDFKRVTTLVPNDAEAKKKFQQCDKEVKKKLFAAAIISEGSQPPSETLDINGMAVPEGYDGPSFEGDTPTPEFVLEMMECFKKQSKMHKKFAFKILIASLKVLQAQANCTPITVPEGERVTVCGDVHGQFYDLLHIFEINGTPSETNPYLFNGDFVDRGSWSVECVITLLAWKACFPGHMFMSRGNHEGRNLNKIYGFEGEVKAKYDEKMFELFQEVFGALPLCHVINDQVFVCHGGLPSTDNVTIADINKVNRDQDVPDNGVMCDLLWSDPAPMPGRTPSKRGVGMAFGRDVTERFLKTNDLKLVIRSHEVKDDGYEVTHEGKLITVFSAPNYCDQIGNKGAFIHLTGGQMEPKFTSFSASEHPPCRPMQYSMMPGMMG